MNQNAHTQSHKPGAAGIEIRSGARVFCGQRRDRNQVPHEAGLPAHHGDGTTVAIIGAPTNFISRKIPAGAKPDLMCADVFVPARRRRQFCPKIFFS
jgi:hypothetical protein